MGSSEGRPGALGHLIDEGICQYHAQLRLLLGMRTRGENTVAALRLLLALSDILDLMHDQQRHLGEAMQP